MAGLFTDFDPLKSFSNRAVNNANTVTKGALISFEYPRSFATVPNIIHDPRPMLIVTDVWPPNYIRGVNLHYLTFPYIKKILETWGGNTSFSYSNIKADKYVALAFRMYSLRGVTRPKRLDSEFLKTVLQSARTFDAGELEKIRANIQQQIDARLQIKANELTAYEQYRRNLQMMQNRVTNIQNAVTNMQPVKAPVAQEQNVQNVQNVNQPEGSIQTE
jgi:hypothetical protein